MATTNTEVTINKVLFEPYNNSFCKITAEVSDGSKKVVYLDNVSAATFMKQALLRGSTIAPTV